MTRTRTMAVMNTTTALVCTAQAVLHSAPKTLHALPALEQERHNRLRRHVDRLSFLAVRVAARLLWSRSSGLSPTECRIEQHCPGCGGPHGRPSFAGEKELAVSWAHSQDLIGVIVGPGCVAIDVETGTNDPPGTMTGGSTQRQRIERWMLAECWTKLGYCDLSAALGIVRGDMTPPPRGGLPLPGQLHRRLLSSNAAHALSLSTDPCEFIFRPKVLLTSTGSI